MAAPQPTWQGRIFRFFHSEHGLYWAAGLAVAIGGALYAAGLLVLSLSEGSTKNWNAVWVLAGAAFAGAVLPLPGLTAGAMSTLHGQPFLLAFGVLGAAIGGTAGAALLLALGQTGRKALRQRAKKSRWTRKVLHWGVTLARKWAYFGVAALLVPPFIPRAPVLYAASLVHLRPIPYLLAVFLGTGLRNLIVAGAFSLG